MEMKRFSLLMCVLDNDMGPNGSQYGITAGCRRFSYEIKAKDINEAQAIANICHLIYDGEIIETYDADWQQDDSADWWKKK